MKTSTSSEAVKTHGRTSRQNELKRCSVYKCVIEIIEILKPF